MVVDDPDIVRVSRSPAKTDPPLRIDPNTVLASSIALELFQAITGRQPQVVEDRRCIKHAELTERDFLNVGAQLPHWSPLEKTLGVAVPEALEHRE